MAIILSPEEKIVPVVPIRDGVIFPHTESVLTFGRPKSLSAIEASYNQERIICFILQKNPKINDPDPSELYNIGTISRIERMLRTNGEINALVRGIVRVKVIGFETDGPYLLARVVELKEEIESNEEINALCKHLTSEFRRAMQLGKSADFLAFMNIMSDIPTNELADQVASTLEIRPTEKQELLEMLDVKPRLEKIVSYLSKEIKILEIERRIVSKTEERFERGAREAILRERLKTIKEELGQEGEGGENQELLAMIK